MNRQVPIRSPCGRPRGPQAPPIPSLTESAHARSCCSSGHDDATADLPHPRLGGTLVRGDHPSAKAPTHTNRGPPPQQRTPTPPPHTTQTQKVLKHKKEGEPALHATPPQGHEENQSSLNFPQKYFGGDLLSHTPSGCSTISAKSLNYRVRNETGCTPLAITTEKLTTHQPPHTRGANGETYQTNNHTRLLSQNHTVNARTPKTVYQPPKQNICVNLRPISTGQLHQSYVLASISGLSTLSSTGSLTPQKRGKENSSRSKLPA